MASVDAIAELPQVVEQAVPMAPAEYNLVVATTLGAWTTYLILARVLAVTVPSLLTSEVEVVRELALAWRGDTLFVYTNVDPVTTYRPGPIAPVTVLVWKVDFADEAAATAVGTRLRAVFGAGALGGFGTSVLLGGLGTSVTVSLSDREVHLGWAFNP
jgi:hypothetical protein